MSDSKPLNINKHRIELVLMVKMGDVLVPVGL